MWVSDQKSRSVNIFSSSWICDFDWISPPRVNRPDKTSAPPRADFSISPSGLNYDMQSISFILDLQGNIYELVKKTYYMSAGFGGRHVVGFEDLSIDMFLEARN